MPGLRERAQALLGDRLGVAVLPAERAAKLEEDASTLRTFREEASDLAYWTLDYFSGRPQEWRPERRKRLTQRARIAFQQDPLAGAEAEHYANFALGRGAGMPEAQDEAVQKVIEDAWTDPVNLDHLTGFDAQRAISNELKAGANVFLLAFSQGGRVRIANLASDRVLNVVTDPEDEDRILWYVCARQLAPEWDFLRDGPKVQVLPADRRIVYHAHWRNLEEAQRERAADPTLEPVPLPPAEKIGPGVVYHVRINRLLGQHFGVSPWARTLRFYTAMNRLTESRVAMAQAAASFIAKRVIKGTPSDITKAASAILQQTGEIGSTYVDPRTGQAPTVRPGSIWNENESSTLQNLSLNSGGASATADAQIVRGAAVAPSAFGQHMFGDASNANLATATALELPALMAINAWQEVFEQTFRWFTDFCLQEAARAGRLGGTTSGAELEPGQRPLGELRVSESEDRAQIEKLTGRDLSYKFQMPYPGRRNLPDVTTAVVQVGTLFGVDNEPLARILLNAFFQHGLELEDPGGAVQEVIDYAEKQAKEAAAAQDAAGLPSRAGAGTGLGGNTPTTPIPPPPQDPQPASTVPSNPRARSGVPPPERPMAEVLEEVARLVPADLIDDDGDARELFDAAVLLPLLASSNGHGDHAEPTEG